MAAVCGEIHSSLGCESRECQGRACRRRWDEPMAYWKEVEFYPSTCIARAQVAVVAGVRMDALISSVVLTLIFTT